jgi:hypothetical protein
MAAKVETGFQLRNFLPNSQVVERCDAAECDGQQTGFQDCSVNHVGGWTT